MTAFSDPGEERDAIFSLLACALAASTWDDSPLGEGSGHNIAAVLVDRDGQPVAWARNEATGRRDLTEHAELRLMRGHIAADPERTELHKHQIYTTLEPCAMCAGMMAMTNIQRVVFGQRDPVYGGVFERLAGGETPYPKRVESKMAPAAACGELEREFARSGHAELIEWLPSPEARAAYGEAARRFRRLTPEFSENAHLLSAARDFLDTQLSR